MEWTEVDGGHMVLNTTNYYHLHTVYFDRHMLHLESLSPSRVQHLCHGSVSLSLCCSLHLLLYYVQILSFPFACSRVLSPVPCCPAYTSSLLYLFFCFSLRDLFSKTSYYAFPALKFPGMARTQFHLRLRRCGDDFARIIGSVA